MLVQLFKEVQRLGVMVKTEGDMADSLADYS